MARTSSFVTPPSPTPAAALDPELSTPIIPSSLSNATTYLAKVVSFAARTHSATPSTASSSVDSMTSTSLPASPIQRYQEERAQWDALSRRRGSSLDPVEYISFPDFDNMKSALSPSPSETSIDATRRFGP